MEIVIGNLIAVGIIIVMVVNDAPTWAWLSMLAAALVGNVLGAISSR